MAMLRSLLAVGGAAVIVLAGEALFIGAALGGGEGAELVTYLSASALMALWVVAHASDAKPVGRRFIEAVSCGLIVFLVLEAVLHDADPNGDAIAYASGIGAGAALALAGRAVVTLAARLVAIPLVVGLVLVLETRADAHDLTLLLPPFALVAVGLADAAVDALRRRQPVLALAVVTLPVAMLVGYLLLENVRQRQERNELLEAAQPGTAREGRERIAWMYPAGGFVTGPLLAGDVVVADAAAAIHGVDARTGRRLWLVRLAGRDGLSAPVVRGNTLLYPVHRGGLHAIDTQTGRRRWTFAPRDDQDVSAVSATAEGVVAAAATGSSVRLYGLDPASGRVRWTKDVGAVEVELSTGAGGAYLETERGRWRISARSGKLDRVQPAPAATYSYGRPAALRSRTQGWLHRPGWEAATSEPLELDGRVYVNIDLLPPKLTGGLHVLDARTGELVWRVEIAGDSEHKPAARGDLVYVTSTGTCAAAGGCRSGLYAIRR